MLIKDNYLIYGDHSINLNDIKKTGVEIEPVRKDAKDTVLNALTNGISHSISNGNEKVNVILAITKNDDTIENIKLNDEILTRNSLDYHDTVRKARSIQSEIKKHK